MSSEMIGATVADLIKCLQSIPSGSKILQATRTGERVIDTIGLGFNEGRITNRRVTVTIEMPDIPWREDTSLG